MASARDEAREEARRLLGLPEELPGGWCSYCAADPEACAASCDDAGNCAVDKGDPGQIDRIAAALRAAEERGRKSAALRIESIAATDTGMTHAERALLRFVASRVRAVPTPTPRSDR